MHIRVLGIFLLYSIRLMLKKGYQHSNYFTISNNTIRVGAQVYRMTFLMKRVESIHYYKFNNNFTVMRSSTVKECNNKFMCSTLMVQGCPTSGTQRKLIGIDKII